MTKFFASIALAAILSTGCTVQPGAVLLPSIPQAQQATTTAQTTPISQPVKTGVDVGVTIQEQAPVVVHNTTSAEPAKIATPKFEQIKVTDISFKNGSDSRGNDYSDMEVWVCFNKPATDIKLYVYDRMSSNKVTDYRFPQQFVQPDQRSFALSSFGLKYDSEYDYMITANDIKTLEQVHINGSFKTGGGKLPESNPRQSASENRDPIIIGNFRSEVGRLGMTDGLWYKELVHVPTDTELTQIHNTLGDGMGDCANVMCTEAYDLHWIKGQDVFDTGIPSWLVTRLSSLAKSQPIKAMAVYSGYWAGPIIVINKSK